MRQANNNLQKKAIIAQHGQLELDRKYKIEKHLTFAARLNAIENAIKVSDIIRLIFF